MSKRAHISYLEQRHKDLESEIAEVMFHTSADDFEVFELKCRKLHLQDELEQLRHVLGF